MHFKCPDCHADRHFDSDELPWEDQDEIEITCYQCEKVLVITAYLTIKHEIKVKEDDGW